MERLQLRRLGPRRLLPGGLRTPSTSAPAWSVLIVGSVWEAGPGEGWQWRNVHVL